MLRDAREPSNDELIETDLCIVGSGPAESRSPVSCAAAAIKSASLRAGGGSRSRRARTA